MARRRARASSRRDRPLEGEHAGRRRDRGSRLHRALDRLRADAARPRSSHRNRRGRDGRLRRLRAQRRVRLGRDLGRSARLRARPRAGGRRARGARHDRRHRLDRRRRRARIDRLRLGEGRRLPRRHECPPARPRTVGARDEAGSRLHGRGHSLRDPRGDRGRGAHRRRPRRHLHPALRAGRPGATRARARGRLRAAWRRDLRALAGDGDRSGPGHLHDGQHHVPPSSCGRPRRSRRGSRARAAGTSRSPRT